MERLEVQGSKTTPHIICDPIGIITISGRSLPENASAFYGPFLEWIEDYINTSTNTTEVNITLDYINSISQKMIFKFLYRMDEHKKTGKTVKINWHFEDGDEEILDEGSIFDKKFDLDFNFIKIEEED